MRRYWVGGGGWFGARVNGLGFRGFSIGLGGGGLWIGPPFLVS